MNRIVELALLYCGQADEIVAGIGNIPIGSYGVAGSRTGAAYRSVFWLPDFLYTVAKAAAFAQQNKLRFTEKNIIRYLKKHLANINNVLRTHIKSPSNNKGHRTAAQRISAREKILHVQARRRLSCCVGTIYQPLFGFC